MHRGIWCPDVQDDNKDVKRDKCDPWTCATDLRRSIEVEIVNVERSLCTLECTVWPLPIKGDVANFNNVFFTPDKPFPTLWCCLTPIGSASIVFQMFPRVLWPPLCYTHMAVCQLCDISALELLAALLSSGWKYKELGGWGGVGGYRAAGLWIGLISGGEGSHPYISCTRDPKANKPLNTIICNH